MHAVLKKSCVQHHREKNENKEKKETKLALKKIFCTFVNIKTFYTLQFSDIPPRVRSHDHDQTFFCIQNTAFLSTVLKSIWGARMDKWNETAGKTEHSLLETQASQTQYHNHSFSSGGTARICLPSHPRRQR